MRGACPLSAVVLVLTGCASVVGEPLDPVHDVSGADAGVPRWEPAAPPPARAPVPAVEQALAGVMTHGAGAAPDDRLPDDPVSGSPNPMSDDPLPGDPVSGPPNPMPDDPLPGDPVSGPPNPMPDDPLPDDPVSGPPNPMPDDPLPDDPVSGPPNPMPDDPPHRRGAAP